MFNVFKRSIPPAPARAAPLEPVPRYPAVDPGMPVVPAAAILASQPELMARLRGVAAADDATFAARYLAPVEAVARHVHLLPASSCDHFAAPGGLFRLCLEMAVFCRQAAEAELFTPTAGAEQRHALEPRWRYAAFLAGLLSELRGPLAQAIVSVPNGATWPALLGGLDGWLARQSADHFHVTWRAGAAASGGRAQVAAGFSTWIPQDALRWLDGGPAAITGDVLAIVLGDPLPLGGGGALARLVAATRQRVIDAEASTRRSRYGRVRFGHHLELHLIDALRHAVASGRWDPAGAHGPLRLGADGLFLDWPAAASTLRDLAQANGVSGIPLSPLTMLDVLGDCGFLTPSPQGDGWLWPADAAVAGRIDEATRSVVRIADPASVLGECAKEMLAVRAPRHEACASASSGAAGPVATRTAPRSPAVAPLSAPEQRLAQRCQQHLAEGRTDLLALLPGPCLAVSQDLLHGSGDDLLRVASALETRGWLGRGDWPGADAKAGMLSFRGKRKPGLVVNADGVRALGVLGA